MLYSAASLDHWKISYGDFGLWAGLDTVPLMRVHIHLAKTCSTFASTMLLSVCFFGFNIQSLKVNKGLLIKRDFVFVSWLL